MVFGVIDVVSGWKKKGIKNLTVSFVWSAHWYLYVLGLCKMQEDDELVEMGYDVSNAWVLRVKFKFILSIKKLNLFLKISKKEN